MSEIKYIKINDIQYNGQDIYFKIKKEIKKASIFNDDYLYFYKEQEQEIKPLGKYIGMDKVSLGIYHHDVDYDVYNFDNGNSIFTNKSQFIYCQELSKDNDSDTNLTLIPDFTYKQWPVYYKPL
jgi:hypothetical protein